VQSLTTRRFRELLEAAPASAREKAKAAYELWAENPSHPSIRFKRVHASLSIYSVRMDLDRRAAGILREGEIVWFRVGPHNEYE
jgi:hypothetical protein